MANKRHCDVHPCKDEQDTHKPAKMPMGKGKPSSAGFKKHPRHTGPKVNGPGEYPSC